MMDDHEVRDDWGFREEDMQEDSFDYLWGEVCK